MNKKAKIKKLKQDLNEADFCISYLLGKARDWEEAARMLAIDLGRAEYADTAYEDVRDGLYDKVRERIKTSPYTYGHRHEDNKPLWDRNVEEVVLLRQMLTHSIYCPRQACSYCSEIEKEVRNEK